MAKEAAPDFSPDFSVVICTYNGALRLPKLLESLQAQQASCRWEVLIVDNNSSDRTAAVVQAAQATWRSDVPLRYCFESHQGLAFARRCAIRHTQGNLIGFLDDDTLPESGWVEAAYRFAEQHPQAGAYGSAIHGIYETPPPPGFHRIACCLAIIDRGDMPFQYVSDRGVLPAGAGMVIRRQAWLEQVPKIPALAGVKAGSLRAKGEDVETLSYIRRSWEIWHNPAMALGHVIPAARLERNYLLNLFWHIGLSRYPLRKIQHRPWLWPLMVGLYCLSDLRKGLRHVWSTQSFLRPLKSLDVVEACEFSLLLGSFLSPFYGLWNGPLNGPSHHLDKVEGVKEPAFDNENLSLLTVNRMIGQRLL
ncbi:MAG: hormogonium polysaccharide biosynthesis glycosyltransferase HpsE [Cyanobacteria bacterium P01_F01_bin.53]